MVGTLGPYIIVAGAVFADTFISQTLTDYRSALPRCEDVGRSSLDCAIHRVARLFRALNICIKELNTYYEGLMCRLEEPRLVRGTEEPQLKRPRLESWNVPNPESRVPSMIMPHFQEFVDDAGTKFTFTYTGRLATEYKNKAVFTAVATPAGAQVSRPAVGHVIRCINAARAHHSQSGCQVRL